MIDYGLPSFDVTRASLFQKDPLVSIEFYHTFKRRTYLEPEKLLMLAVLEDAVMCIQKHANHPAAKSRKIFDETREWMLAKDDEHLFSFGSICESLGLDAAYLRRELQRVGEKAGTRRREPVNSSAQPSSKQVEKRLRQRNAVMG